MYYVPQTGDDIGEAQLWYYTVINVPVVIVFDIYTFDLYRTWIYA